MPELVAGVLLAVIGGGVLLVATWHGDSVDAMFDPWGWLYRNHWIGPALLTAALLIAAGILLIYRGWDVVF